jgi:hypothetical protein
MSFRAKGLFIAYVFKWNLALPGLFAQDSNGIIDGLHRTDA